MSLKIGRNPSVARKATYRLIDDERDYQDRKWGEYGPDSRHNVGDWLTFMRTYLDRATAAYTRDDGERLALIEIRKLTALSIACMENFAVPPRSANPRADNRGDRGND